MDMGQVWEWTTRSTANKIYVHISVLMFIDVDRSSPEGQVLNAHSFVKS